MASVGVNTRGREAGAALHSSSHHNTQTSEDLSDHDDVPGDYDAPDAAGDGAGLRESHRQGEGRGPAQV